MRRKTLAVDVHERVDDVAQQHGGHEVVLGMHQKDRGRGHLTAGLGSEQVGLGGMGIVEQPLSFVDEGTSCVALAILRLF